MKLLRIFLPERFTVSLTFVATVATLCVLTSVASAATELVGDFGDGGWYSWDTRNTSGTALNGSNDTSPSINSTLLGRAVGGPTTADDTAIEKQIVFMDEGQTVNDENGRVRPAAPAGSLNGLGYVRLDGTSTNSGKSDISYVDTNGIAASTALLNVGFGLSYRFYIDAGLSFRTLGLNIAINDSAQTNNYIFAYVDPAAVAGPNTSSVSASSGTFRLIINGTAANGGAMMTLSAWSTDPNGAPAFGTGENIYRIGFNIGSGQMNGLQYLDWMQTNLLNGGDIIDFVGPSAVPETSTWLIGALAMSLLTVQVVRARAFSKRAQTQGRN